MSELSAAATVCAIKCKDPQRGIWGGPPDGGYQTTIAAGRTAFAPRGKLELASVINRDLWEINFHKAAAPGTSKTPAKPKTMGFGGGAIGALLVVALFLVIRRRRR